MIFVCELGVKGASHEKVNSAFLRGVVLAYPGERVRLFADPSHINALQHVATIDGLDLSAVDYVSIPIGDPDGPAQFLKYTRQLRSIFQQAVAARCSRILFLSASPAIQVQAKRQQAKSAFRNVELCFVLHAAFEAVATDKVQPLDIPPLPAGSQQLFDVARTRGWSYVFSVAARQMWRRLSPVRAAWAAFSGKYLAVRRVMDWRHSDKVRYIALSPHIIANASRYLNTDAMHISALVLPTVFRDYQPHLSDDYPRFAVFGYGNSAMLHAVLKSLSENEVSHPYEIKIIGMDNRGTTGFANINAVSPGKFMDREDMERHVADVDMFLILYDRSRYRLSCSNAVLEALSYSKPILHLANDCVDYFDQPTAPIGYREMDVDGFASKMCQIIENFAAFRPELQQFGRNLESLRARYRLESQLTQFRAAFEGQPPGQSPPLRGKPQS